MKKLKRRWALISLSIFLSSASSLFADPICDLPELMASKITPLSVPAGYWFNALDDRYILTMAGGRRGVDLQTGKEFSPMTGSFDPYPAPTRDGIDRKIYVHPDPFRFHYFPDVLNGKMDPVFSDAEMKGWYESLGTLSSVKNDHENYSTYRGITANGNGLMRDYRVDFEADGHVKSVKPIQDHPVTLCSNWRDDRRRMAGDPDPGFHTPILSPKGDEMALTDQLDPKHTIIVKINPANGDCTKVDDLGMTTGKVHFSPDGTKIGFSSYSLSLQGLGTSQGAGDQPIADSNEDKREPLLQPYVWDRTTKKIIPVSIGNYGEDHVHVPFTGFMPDGKVLYYGVSVDADGNQRRFYAQVDLEGRTGVKNYLANPKEQAACPVPNDKELRSQVVLGRMWLNICGKVDLKSEASDTDAALLTTRLSPDLCKKLVENDLARVGAFKSLKHATLNERDAKALTRQNLLDACPKSVGNGTATIGSVIPQTVKKSMPNVIMDRCMGCHGRDSSGRASPNGYIPWDNPDELARMPAYIYDSNHQVKGTDPNKTFLSVLKEGLNENPPRFPPVGDNFQLTPSQVKAIKDWAGVHD